MIVQADVAWVALVLLVGLRIAPLFIMAPVFGSIPAPAGTEREFFQQHLSPWIRRLFIDLEHAEGAEFYSAVGLLGRTFVDLEAEAFSRSA